MSILLRPLYAKAAFMRPDLEEETGKIGFAVQEAMREVCRRTFLARASVALTAAAAAHSVPITMPAGNSLLKVHRASFLETGSTDPAIVLGPANYTQIEDVTKDVGVPRVFAQKGSILYLWPSTEVGGTVTIEYSYVPLSDVDEVPLPEMAITAIEARAESMILRVPDPKAGSSTGADGRSYQSRGYQSLEHARVRERDFHACLGNLKWISDYGEGGDVLMVASLFPGAP